MIRVAHYHVFVFLDCIAAQKVCLRHDCVARFAEDLLLNAAATFVVELVKADSFFRGCGKFLPLATLATESQTRGLEFPWPDPVTTRRK
jgi:hypothetical protein